LHKIVVKFVYFSVFTCSVTAKELGSSSVGLDLW